MDQTLDKKIIKAITDVRQKSKTLTKSSFNPHGRYKYVSIDTYYEKVVPLATEVGLVWRSREVDWKIIGHNDKSYVQAAYAFDLYTADAAAPDFMRVTVCSPLTGPQTAGQMFSYADKVFMRVAFAIASGESDGDDVEQEESRAPTKTTPAHDPITGVIADVGLPPINVEGAPVIDTRTLDEPAIKTVVEIFKTWMPKVTNRPRLHDWHGENVAALEKIRKLDPNAAEEIKAMFNTRNAELKAMEKE